MFIISHLTIFGEYETTDGALRKFITYTLRFFFLAVSTSFVTWYKAGFRIISCAGVYFSSEHPNDLLNSETP